MLKNIRKVEMCERRAGNLYPFLWMGCWNTEGAPRNAVLAAIRVNPIKNVVLAGDNVYPRVKKGPHETSVFDEGIAGLAGKTIVTSAFGNHNLEEPDVGLPAHQREVFGRPPAGPLYFCIEYDDAALVVLDTNIMEDPAAVAEMAAYAAERIAELGEKPYYVLQHEPFASYKTTKNPILKNGEIVLDILAAATNQPVAILCADTHNYQEGIIRVGAKSIRQIVVGTGGASSDSYNPDLPERRIRDVAGTVPITYTLDRDISVANANRFGYYQMNSVGDGHFVPVLPWIDAAAAAAPANGAGGAAAAAAASTRRGGRRRKSRRTTRKRKYNRRR